MVKYLMVFTLAMFATVGDASASDRQVSVVGGTEVLDGSFGWMASVWVPSENEGYFAFNCGGTVIGSRWILTAAHCVDGGREVLVGYGDNDVNRHGESLKSIRQVVIHPSWQRSRYLNDIALIETVEPIDVEPVSLPSSGAIIPLTGELATVAGWGRTRNSDRAVARLRSADLEIKSTNSCFTYLLDIEQRDGIPPIPTHTLICTGAIPNTPLRGQCKGDSGGPLVVRRGGQPVQVGIVSFSEDCADTRATQYTTRVGEYLSWIGSYVDDVNSQFPSGFSIDHLPDSYTTLPVNSSITDVLSTGQSRVFRVSNVTTATLTSNSGDADMIVFRGRTFSDSNAVCYSRKIVEVESCQLPDSGDLYIQVFGYDASRFTLEVTDQNGVVFETISPVQLIQDTPVSSNIDMGESVVYKVANGLTLSLVTEFGDTEMRVFNSQDFSVLSLECTDRQFCDVNTNAGVAYVQVYGLENSRFSLTAGTTRVQPAAELADNTNDTVPGTSVDSVAPAGGSSGGGVFGVGFMVLLILRRKRLF